MILSNLSKDLELVHSIVNFALILKNNLETSKTILSLNIFQTHFRINVHSVTQSWGLIKLCLVIFNVITKINKDFYNFHFLLLTPSCNFRWNFLLWRLWSLHCKRAYQCWLLLHNLWIQYRKRCVSDVRNHIESKHFPNSFNCQCSFCAVVLKTNKALPRHVQNHHQNQ